MYIGHYTIKSARRKFAPPTRLGWDGDDFLLPTCTVTPDGVEGAAPQGSVKDWTEGIAYFSREASLGHQFAIQAAFGSVLLGISGKGGAVVALVGKSATGKSLTADLCLSIYGAPLDLRQEASASPALIAQHMAYLGDIPHVLDDVHRLQAGKIAEHIMLSTESRRAALSIMTSLKPFAGEVDKALTESHLARVIDVQSAKMIDRASGRDLYNACIAANAGTAAIPFIQWAIKNKHQVTALLEKAEKFIISETKIPDEYRFCAWTIAAALVAGTAARSLKLINWDPMSSALAVASSVASTQLVDDYTPDKEKKKVGQPTFRDLAWSLVSLFVEQNRDKAILKDGTNDGKQGMLIKILDDGTVMVRRAELVEFLRDQKKSTKTIQRIINSRAIVWKRAVKTISKGSPVRSICLYFKREHLSLGVWAE